MPRRSRSSSLTRGCAAAGSPGALRVSFLHPDLGLGGAERLVVDAASSLASRGHSVTVYTSHWEPARAFAETRREHAGGAHQATVFVYGLDQAKLSDLNHIPPLKL